MPARFFPPPLHGLKRLAAIFALLLLTACDGGSAPVVETPPLLTDATALSAAIVEGETLLGGAVAGVLDGNYYADDLDAVAALVEQAKAVFMDPAATQEQADLIAPTLAEATFRARDQQISRSKDLERILDGVTDLTKVNETNGSCSSSYIAAFQGNGFLIFNKKPYGLGTIAAGRYGKGRIYLSGNQVNCYMPKTNANVYPQNTQLAMNVLAWLTERSSAHYTDTLAGGAPLKVLLDPVLDLGSLEDPIYNLEPTQVTDIPTQQDLFDPQVFPVAFINPVLMSEEAKTVLEKYVLAGGSLLMGREVGGIPALDIKRMAGQELASRAGIAYGWGYTSAGGVIPPVQQLLDANVKTSLELMRTVQNDWANRANYGYSDTLRDTIGSAASDGLRGLPLERTEIRKWLDDSYFGLNLKYPNLDLTAQPFTKVLVKTYHMARNLEPGQPQSPGVEVYPGTVAADAPRVTRTLTFDFNKVNPTWMRTFRIPRNTMSTGLYAPPGEDITIKVAEGVPYTASGGKTGLQVKVGLYYWDQFAKDSWLRPPKIYFLEEVEVGEEVVNSPIGGLIYLSAEYSNSRDAKVEVTISGAVEAPYFVKGRDTDATWIASIRETPAPMGELEGENMIITTDSETLRALEKPEELIAKFDAVVDNSDAFSGMSPGGLLPHATTTLPWRITSVLQTIESSAHAGYPIGWGSTNLGSMFSLEYWGSFYHEMGHNFFSYYTRCNPTSHGMNDIFTVYNQWVFGETSRTLKLGNYDSVEVDLTNQVPWPEISRFDQMVFYHQIALVYGWDAYTTLFTYLRELPSSELDDTEQVACDLLLTKMSEITGHDLRSHFAHYGITNTQAALDAVAAMKTAGGAALPEPDPAVWKYREDVDGTIITVP